MIDLTAHIPAGAGVCWSQGPAEPAPLIHALLDQLPSIGTVRAFCGLSWDQRLGDPPDGLSLTSYGALGTLRKAAGRGRLNVVPCHYSALPRLFAESALPRDVALLQVSPPDQDGQCSLGLGVDYIADALPHCTTVIAEINARMPRTRGPSVPLARFAATVETDRPLPEAPDRAPDDTDRLIAGFVADLVPDGATIQIGVGPLPSAVLAALSQHRELGFHSGMMTDGVLDLIEAGVLTGSRKEVDRGVAVTGAAFGSERLYTAVPGLPVEFRPASYTHAPDVLGRIRSLVAVNSAIEVDLTGQVGGELRDGRYIGTIGGQTDFSRAACHSGLRSVILLRATASGRSTIREALADGVVTTARADVDAVVTEYGVALLRGRTLAQRARQLVAVAAPEHRDELALAAKRY
ncbi:MAG TPA: acetyl-CoA hydrolase/transferase C-terminal domain-containing protein [Acidimicrobiia bacterium]|nr:acetyl-CoA hydrolase/transferase C-terminal domain-containing protein [Acidimicrobiia bacterium]